MAELQDLLNDIEALREKLQKLIEKKQGNLIDPDVVAVSKILNATLNEYDLFLK